MNINNLQTTKPGQIICRLVNGHKVINNTQSTCQMSSSRSVRSERLHRDRISAIPIFAFHLAALQLLLH